MPNKDHLTVYHNEPAQDIPLESKDQFVALIEEGKLPSEALKAIMEKYDLKSLDHSITFAFLRAAYPNADLMDEGLSSRVIDSNYPNHKEGLSDEEFDSIISRIKEGSDSW